MAKRTPRKVTGNKWEPRPNDAIRLAAIRWYACRLEMEAIQVYATDATQYQAMEAILGECITQLHSLVAKKPIGADSDCPPGYVNCGGECAPQCNFD